MAAIRFQKRVSIFPGLRLNFSASGMSATIGVPGASVTLGGRTGPMANFGIPGSGFSTRIPLQRLKGGGGGESWPEPQTPATPASTFQAAIPLSPIGSSSPSELCSAHLQELRDYLCTVRDQREAADAEFRKSRHAFETAHSALSIMQDKVESVRLRQERLRKAMFAFFRKARIKRIDRAVEKMQPRIVEAISRFKHARAESQAKQAELEGIWIDGALALPGPAQSGWESARSAFTELTRSAKIWDVTAERIKRPGEERSVATSIIERTPVSLSQAKLDFFLPETDALFWPNANGDDLYFYPGFIVVVRTERDFALIDMRDVVLELVGVRFTEEEEIPPDTNRVGSTWAKCNKDGSRDLRFAGNREIPIVQYGQINLRSSTGLNEAFMFSNAVACETFCRSFAAFRSQMSLAPAH